MNRKPKLFSYCIPVDDGAAPNPYGGVCTLVICKPVIRRVCEEGDWVVATGSKNSPIGDISSKVVYAMKITKKMSLVQYDKYCNDALRIKIPVRDSKRFEKVVGDCIYDFSENVRKPALRLGVHGEENRETDLRGENALLSTHFYYFGVHAEKLPKTLMEIIKTGRGHKSDANDPYADDFISWIDANYELNKLYGEPQLKEEILKHKDDCKAKCSKTRREESEEDELYYFLKNLEEQGNYHKRIGEVLKKIGMSAEDLAVSLNLPNVSSEKIKQYLERTAFPSKEFLYALKDKFGISYIWIILGKSK